MRPALALAEKELVMSIWKDLLLLGGYVATPAGLATVAPETASPAESAPPVAPPPRMRARIVSAPRSRPLPPANKISPNDLW